MKALGMAQTRSFAGWHLFVPKLATALREGYGLAEARADLFAGLTVAVVALPLSLALAIASGVSPGRGLFTAIVAGAIVSALGGSRYQIAGPTGAFVVVVAGVVQQFGYEGLAAATFMAGVLLIITGIARLGTYIKYIPFPVVTGFTAGIAVVIFSSQVGDVLGLKTFAIGGEDEFALLPDGGRTLPQCCQRGCDFTFRANFEVNVVPLKNAADVGLI